MGGIVVWRSIRELPTWLRVFVLGRLIKSTGSMGWLFMAVYLVDDRGVDPTTAGLIVAANGVGVIAGSLGGGWLGDRCGIRRTMILSSFLSALISLAVPFTATGWLAPLSAAGGLIGGVAFPLGMALVTGALPAAQRRTGVALARAAMNAGVVLGPPLGALAAAHDFRIVFIVEAVAGLALTAIIWRWVPASDPAARPAGRAPIRLWRAVAADRSMWMLLLAVLAVDAAYRQIFTGLPLMLTDDGGRLLGYGALIALSSLLIVLAETPLAIRLAGQSAHRIITAGYVFIGLGFLALVAWPHYLGAVAAIGLITVGEMLYKPTSAAYAADRAPDGMNGRYQSLYSTASIGGMIIAPSLGGYVYQHAPGLLWPICAGLALIGAAAFARWGRPKPSTVSDPDQPAALGDSLAEAVRGVIGVPHRLRRATSPEDL